MRKHFTLDAYGAKTSNLEDIKYINDVLNRIIFDLKLNPITPPQLIPYYYGKVKEDIGLTAFLLLEGGHITIHTFPLRKCYFLDIYTPDEFDDKLALELCQDFLPFKLQDSFTAVVDRDDKTLESLEYDPIVDFGPHLMSELTPEIAPTMESIYDFLENLVTKISMDPITRAYIQKSTVVKPKYLSGMIIIAQSHIALHYNYKTKTIMADIFSCAPFDFTLVSEFYDQLGKTTANRLVPRGSKHIYKVQSKVKKDDLRASTRWQKAMKQKN